MSSIFANKCSQKGISSAAVVISILIFITLMGSGGFFKPPKSPVNETTRYTVSESQPINKPGLQLGSLKFTSSTPPPTTIPPTIPASTARPTPIPTIDYCYHDQGKIIDRTKCNCDQWEIRCENGYCVEIIDKNSPGGVNPNTDCSDVNEWGWCRPNQYGKEGNGWYCIGKPVIYLYPLSPMLVTTKVSTSGEIYVSDPQIEYGVDKKVGGLVSHASEIQNEPNRKEGGWTNVLAFPDGTLYYKNKNYRELFYESKTKDIKRPEKGIVIDKTNLRSELLSFITQLGLTRKDEQDEFMDWWIPQLLELPTDKIFVSILDVNEKQRLDKVMITPKPDTFIEFIVYFAPLKDHETVTPLTLPPTPERKGFTAIEWGGVIAR